MKIHGQNPEHADEPLSGFLNWINLLSLDVVFGALCSGFFAARIVGADMEWPFWIVLAITVWVVYMLDHLLDAYRLKAGSHSQRHRFAYHYFRVLTVIASVLMVIDVFLVVIFLEKELLIFGAAAGMLILSYFAGLYLARGRYFFLLQKEIIVAFFYLAGIWGGPILKVGFNLQPYVLWSMAAFYCLAVSNALVLSHNDRDVDKKDKHISFAVSYGRKRTKNIIVLLCALAFLIAFFILFDGSFSDASAVAGIYITMAVIMGLLVHRTGNHTNSYLYRILAEGVFWLPGLLFIF